MKWNIKRTKWRIQQVKGKCSIENLLGRLDENAKKLKENKRVDEDLFAKITPKQRINQKVSRRYNLPKVKTDIHKVYAIFEHPTLKEIGKTAENKFYYVKLKNPERQAMEKIKAIISKEDSKHLKTGSVDLDRISQKRNNYTIIHPNPLTIIRIIQKIK